MKIVQINTEYAGCRIDAALAEILSVPRAQVQKAIKEGLVLIADKAVKASYKVVGNEEVSYQDVEVVISDLTPYDFPLEIVFEDEYLLVVNKPAGLVVHPSFGHKEDTLVNALISRNTKLSDINGEFRPGIVHRLDKETSGLLIVCKNNEVHNKVAKLLKDHKIKRRYMALVVGSLKEDGGIIKTYLTRSKQNYQKMENNPTNGKLAISEFTILERFPGYMLMEIELKTGRTHQIRAHMEYLNTPVVGDNLYGTNNQRLYNKGQLLHAAKLSFKHPYTKEKIELESKLPHYFEEVLNSLRTNL